MTKICIIAPIHHYSDIRIFQKEAITLKSNGYQVVLFARSEESGLINGIEVIKAPDYSNRIHRFLLQPKIFFSIIRLKGDIYHIHNPDMLLIGFLLKLIGRKVIYDTHEDFSKRILMRDWIPFIMRRLIAKLVSALEKLGSFFFNAVIVTQSHMTEEFGRKSYLIENAPILNNDVSDKAYEIAKLIEKDDLTIRLIYVGGISNVRGIIETIDVLEILNIEGSYRLWLIGPCADDKLLDKLSQKSGWKYVDYLGFLPQEEAFAYIIKSDIGLVTILDVGDHSTTSPNKLFEYQRFSLPFIASNFPKWVDQVGHTKSGLFVDPLNIKEIVEKVSMIGESFSLRREMGENGQQYIFKEYNWDIESKTLLELYEKLEKEGK